MKHLLAVTSITAEQHKWLSDESDSTLESKAAIIRRLIQVKVNAEASRKRKKGEQ